MYAQKDELKDGVLEKFADLVLVCDPAISMSAPEIVAHIGKYGLLSFVLISGSSVIDFPDAARVLYRLGVEEEQNGQ
jgi:hypothetical protein